MKQRAIVFAAGLVAVLLSAIQLSKAFASTLIEGFGSEVICFTSLLLVVVLSGLLFASWLSQLLGFGISWAFCLIGCAYSGFMFGMGDHFRESGSGSFYEMSITYWAMSLVMLAQLVWFVRKSRPESS